MKSAILTTFLSCLIIFAQAQKEDTEKDYSEAFQLIEVWLEAQKDYEQLPGISATIVEDQDIIWSGGMGKANLEEEVPFRAATLCSICSISKLFTSVAIMKLYDEGKLRLDDQIDELLPHYNIEQQYPESGPITIRSLLTHSSGLPREAAYPYWTGPDFSFPSSEEVKANLGEQQTLYPASTYFQYSNLGLTLLGEVVEEISGMPYEDYVQMLILDPLGLDDTRTEMPEALYGNDLAIGYGALTRHAEREKLSLFQANGITPAAGFSSNVLDLGKFASWQFRLRDTSITELLKPSTLRNMHNVHWTDPDWETTWGLGFSVFKGPDGSTWAGHGGSCPGYRSSLQLDLKNKRAFAVMINASGTNPGKYVRGINAILNKIETIDGEDSSQKMPDLKEYTGFYNQQPWWGEVYIMPGQGKLLALYLPADNPVESISTFKHINQDTFRRELDDGELGETLIFNRDQTGKIISYERHGNFYNRLKQ